MDTKKIGYVTKGNEMGITHHGKRHVRYVLTIGYADGTETAITTEGQCVAYLPDGFIVKSSGRYQFYDENGILLADKDMSQYGDCVEIAVLNDLYIFDTFGDRDRIASEFVYGKNRFVFDVHGNVADVPDPMIGWPVDQLYSYWDSELGEDASAEDVASELECDLEGTPLNLEYLHNILIHVQDKKGR